MFTNNYSITQLFFKKELSIIIEKEIVIKLTIPSIGHFLDDEELYKFFEIIGWDPADIKKQIGIDLDSKFEFIKMIFFTFAKYEEFFDFKKLIEKQLKFILQDKLRINYAAKEFTITTNLGDVIMTNEIWDYITYVLQLTYGKKVVLPPTFNTPEERKFYMAQQAAEKRIAELRKNNKPVDDDFLIKMLLAITYSFPNLSFDYLFNQTMAQIQWLYKYALESVSYEVNAQACATGNMKKNKKLEFFIN